MATNTPLKLAVRECVQLAQDVRGLTLVDPNGEPLPEWTPGAHVDITLPSGLKRCYSLCGTPEARDEYRIAVLREADGDGGSHEVHASDIEGVQLEVNPPTNQFELVDARHYLFVAGGIGITPLLPMIHAVAACGASWRLHYFGRSRERMAFVDEVSVLANANGAAAIHAKNETGAVDLAAILAEAPRETVVYCCGPERMLGEVKRLGEQADDLEVHIERFGRPELNRSAAASEAAVEPAAGNDATIEPIDPDSERFEVELRASGVVLDVGPDDTILGKAREVKQGLSFNCTEGICGTCETAVIAGTPCHRDEVLSDEEKADNDTMMICIGRSRTRRLILDL